MATAKELLIQVWHLGYTACDLDYQEDDDSDITTCATDVRVRLERLKTTIESVRTLNKADRNDFHTWNEAIDAVLERLGLTQGGA